MSAVHNPRQNHLLAALPATDFDRLQSDLKLVPLPLGEVLYEMAQTAVCNRHHSLDQQLCRWLLLSLDRLPGNALVMTQELIANMLGVRREGVTEAAGNLRMLAVVKKEYDRLLPRGFAPARVEAALS